MAWLTILVEFIGGLATLLCAFVSLASLPIRAVVLIAVFAVHLQYGFGSIRILVVTRTVRNFWVSGLRNESARVAASFPSRLGDCQYR